MKFRKIISVLASAIMLSSTIGFAAAASFPEPFVSSGTADGAIVYGVAGATSDLVAAVDLQSNLQGLVTTSSAGGATVTGTAWQVATTSDDLEIGESIADITSYIDSSDLSLLADGEISNEKGTAKYEQFLYFEEKLSSMVNYTENDDDVVGLFYYTAQDAQIARYVMDFITPLKSDVTSANRLEDIEDEEITILGKTYIVTKAENSSATDTDLTLMSGAAKGTVSNDEEVVIGGRTVSVVVSATNAAQFTIDGETTNKLNEGDTEPLSDGTYVGVTDITYQDFSGGLMQSTIYLGADKIFLDDGSAMQVNAETIDETSVNVTETYASGDVSITEIFINMTAEDDLWVPVDGKLSTADDLDEPEVLISQNWDIEFSGLDTHNTEEFKLSPTGSDKKYELKFNNYDGTEITFPLLYTNNTGVYGGKQPGKELVISPNGSASSANISKDDYFILNTADPTDASKNARSYVLRYKGSSKTSDTSPKVTFEVLGVGDREVTLDATGTFALKLGGQTFDFKNDSDSALTNSDVNIVLTEEDYTYEEGLNLSMTAFLRTQYNVLINITNTNEQNVYGSVPNTTMGVSSDWKVHVQVDDATRDDDDMTLSNQEPYTLEVVFSNGSDSDCGAVVEIMGTEITDPDDTYTETIQTKYGVFVDSNDPSAAPATVILTIPESFVIPLVYVTSGDVTITPGTVGGGGQILVVKDSEVSSVSGKNLVVVGGSCINTVAAKILGSDTPMCEAAFTTATGAGAGQYIIKTVTSPYDATKVAMLVAGYNAADTTNAVAKAKEGVDSTVDTEQVYPITTA